MRVKHVRRNGKIVHVGARSTAGHSRTRKSSSRRRSSQPRKANGQFKKR